MPDGKTEIMEVFLMFKQMEDILEKSRNLCAKGGREHLKTMKYDNHVKSDFADFIMRSGEISATIAIAAAIVGSAKSQIEWMLHEWHQEKKEKADA